MLKNITDLVVFISLTLGMALGLSIIAHANDNTVNELTHSSVHHFDRQETRLIDAAMQPLINEWAEIKYQVPKEDKKKRLLLLIEKVERVAHQNPQTAVPLVWHGTMLSTLASLKSGLKALAAAKQAKTYLESSLQKDPTAENGYANVILGALYAKVPGKPLGFGNKKTAKKYFQTALKMNPSGLDANYFYGEFLLNEGQYNQAKQYLEKAQQSPVNAQQKTFEHGRRQELSKALQVVNKKIRS